MISYSLILIGLSLVLCTAFPTDVSPQPEKSTESVRFYCIRSGDKEYKLTQINDEDLSKKVDLTKDFGFYVHGWLSKFEFDQEDKITHKIGLAWVKAKDTNFCGVDWRELAQDGYYDASQKHVKYVATQLSKFIKGLYDRKVKMDSISIAGHSLGAHVAGYAGRLIYESTKKKIGTIFGLDPAGPFFSSLILKSDAKLTKANAKFVQVLHTSSGTFGTKEILGHADFIVNDGNFQEKCVKTLLKADDLLLKCSHSHANEIFLSSFINQCVGVNFGVEEKEEKSTNFLEAIKNFFIKPKVEYGTVTPDRYGIHNKGELGVFKLRTDPASPYCVKA